MVGDRLDVLSGLENGVDLFVILRRDGERNVLLVFRMALCRDHDFFDLLGIGRRYRKRRCGHRRGCPQKSR